MPKRLPHLKIGSFWMFASCGMKYSLRSSRSPEKPSLVSLPTSASQVDEIRAQKHRLKDAEDAPSSSSQTLNLKVHRRHSDDAASARKKGRKCTGRTHDRTWVRTRRDLEPVWPSLRSLVESSPA